jgi:hypothetical protein
MATTILQAFSWANVALFVAIYTSYQICKLLYRITLHPLARFPGPKFAAATHMYEFYYDAIKGGSYIHEISKMHDVYGRCIPV